LIASNRWRGNRHVVAPRNAFEVHLAPFRRDRRDLVEAIAGLAPGSPVVVSISAPWAAARCRRFASKVGIDIHREYVALPTARTPAYLVEDAPASAAAFVQYVLVVPPRAVLSGPIDAALTLIRRLHDPSRALRMLAPSRIVVGARR
jgi:hypothetical protein